jgi:hypothetical protein
MNNKYSLAAGQHFIDDLADALGVSFRSVDPHSEVFTCRRVRPQIKPDYLIAGELGCFNGGATLARVRIFRDAKFDDGLIVSLSQFDPKVIPHARRLFLEQDYAGIGFCYLTGPDVPNKVQILRRHAA